MNLKLIIKTINLLCFTILITGCSDKGATDKYKCLFDPSTTTTTITTAGGGGGSSGNIQYLKYSIYYDTNGNKIVNPNETIRIKVYLKNIGNGDAIRVHGVLTEDSSYVTLTTYGGVTEAAYYNSDYLFSYGKNLYYGIPAGIESNTTEAWNGGGYGESSDYSYEFTIGSAPIGHKINFTLNITDILRNSWTSSFSITVQ